MRGGARGARRARGTGDGATGALRLAAVAMVGVLSGCGAEGGALDVAIVDGLVIDSETRLIDRMNVGIRDGTIVAVTKDALEADRTVDATGLVVSPGFVDLHEHGQSEAEYALMVRDGVTTALELEVGTEDVAGWYAEREGGQLVNHGVSVGHIRARMQVLGDPSTALLPAGVGGFGAATDAQIGEMEGILRRGMREGAVAVGAGSAYTPGAEMSEIERMFRVAAEFGAPVHVHMRGGRAGLDSTIAAAASAGASLHVVHLNSSAGSGVADFLQAISEARAAGQDVTTEAYPYAAGMTEIQTALYDDWESWPDEAFGRYQLVATGERLTRASFGSAREQGGHVISHTRTEESTREAVVSPLTMIASDGFMVDGRGHPRTSGTYARVLGRYVRDEQALPLVDAIAKMTLMPARRLESRVPSMSRKGRIQVGADADVTIFDPIAVADLATYEDAALPSAGIPFVIVGGRFVVDGGALTGERPGRAIRAPTR